MDKVTIYFNSRCSKCRQTLAILEEKGITPEVVYYLENNLSKEQLQELLNKLDMKPSELVRKGEEVYKELKSKEDASEENILNWMISNPILIERPIVVNEDKAVVARPPEKVLEIL